jgi:carboxymethylenebutenolidase
MSCCPDGSWPAMQAPADYSPRGSEIMLENSLPAYVVGDSSEKALIVFPEVFCWEGRLKGICDFFAERGYYVIMPDIMRGDSMSNHFESEDSKQAFLSKWGQWAQSEGDCRTVFAHLNDKGISNIGSVGFCWGAWIIFRASADGMPLKAGAGCHPSLRLEGYSGGTVEDLSTKVNCPMMLASARNDPDNVQAGGEVSRILSEKFSSSEVVSYPDADHGWVSRGDISDEIVAKNVADALKQCEAFFAANV